MLRHAEHLFAQEGSHMTAFSRSKFPCAALRWSTASISSSIAGVNKYATSQNPKPNDFCHRHLTLTYRVIKKDGLKEPVPVAGSMASTVNGASNHARQLDALFQVLCSLYVLTCVGYAQKSLEFVSHSPLIHVEGRSFCLYTDSLFARIGDSNDKCSSSLEVKC